jgi:hypothetical protein
MVNKIGLGRLPGDIVIERDNFHVYIPLATSLLASVILSLMSLWLANRWPSAPLALGGRRSGVLAAGLPAASSSAP